MSNDAFYAYVAGFLDGDGSIYVRLKPNRSYRYGFQIAPSVVFFQKDTARPFFEKLRRQLGIGYLRQRNDGILEYTVGDRAAIRQLLSLTLPHLRLKKKQALLMLNILDTSEAVQSADDFLKVARLIDRFATLNYSKKRIIHAEMVRYHLEHNVRTINPVETSL